MSGERSDVEETGAGSGTSDVECPVCGAINEAGAVECRICGASLLLDGAADMVEGVIDGPGEEPTSYEEMSHTEDMEEIDLSDNNSVICPICGAENPPGSTECSVCGAELPEQEAKPETLIVEEPEDGEAPVIDTVQEKLSEVEPDEGEEVKPVTEESPEPEALDAVSEAIDEGGIDEEGVPVEVLVEAEGDEEAAGPETSAPEGLDSTEPSEDVDEIQDEDVIIEDESSGPVAEEPAAEEVEEELVIEDGGEMEITEETETGEDVAQSSEELRVCEFCGAEVPVDAKVCPVCGEKFNGGEIECPVCGAHNPLGVTSCVVCGADLTELPEKESEEPVEEEGAAEPAEPEAEEPEVRPSEEEISEPMGLVCPVCGSPVDAEDVMCKNCWTDLTIMIKCPSCGALNQPDAATCRVCFAPLKEVELAVPEEEEIEEEPEPESEEIEPETEEEVTEETAEKGVVSCPACSSTNYHVTDDGLAVCDDCGNVFAVTEAEISCPVCGESDFDVSDNGLARCNVCGNVFFVDIIKPEVKEEEEEPEEPKPLKVHYPPKRFDWSTYAVIGLVVILLLSSAIPFLMPIPQAPREIITPDGQFGDWQNITSYRDSLMDSPNPNINIEESKVASDFRNIYFYLRVTGTQFGDQRGDTTRIFIDADNDASTGYAMMNFGADYLIKIDGHDGMVSGTSVYAFNGTNRLDWAGFESAGAVATPYSSGSELEVRMSLESLSLNDTPVVSVMFFTSDTNGNQDHSDFAISNVGGSIYIESSVPHSNQVITASQNDILDLTVHSTSYPATLHSLHFVPTGTADLSAFSVTVLRDGQPLGTGVMDGDGVTVNLNTPLSLEANSSVQLSVAIDAPSSQRGETIGLRLTSAEATPGIAYAELSPVMNFYVLEVPAGMVIDGAFSDWAFAPLITEPAGDAVNKDGTSATTPEALNLDLTSYCAVNQGGSAFLYAGVTADIFSGNAVPEIDTPHIQSHTRALSKNVSDVSSDTQTEPVSNFDFKAPQDAALQRVPKQEITGESSMMFFVDSDRDLSTGYVIGGIGADYMIKLSGIYGIIESRSVMKFTGSDGSLWSWETEGSVSAYSSMNRTEVGIPLADLDMNSSSVADVYVHYINWNGMGDTSDSHFNMSNATDFSRAQGGAPPSGYLTGYVKNSGGTPVPGATVVARMNGKLFTNISWNNSVAGANSNYRIDLGSNGEDGDSVTLFATDGARYGWANTTYSTAPVQDIYLNYTFASDIPTAAVNFSAVNGGESGKAVNLSWFANSSGPAYRIYRTSNFQRGLSQGTYSSYLTDVSGLSYTDSSASNGSTYKYLVATLNDTGSPLAYSMESMVTADYTPPSISLTGVSSFVVRAHITDNVYVDHAEIHYRNWDEANYSVAYMRLTDGTRSDGMWVGNMILNPAYLNYTIYYYISATDGTPYSGEGTGVSTLGTPVNAMVLNLTANKDPYVVYGYVFDINGNSVTGASVWVNYTSGTTPYSYNDTTDSSGRYQVDLDPGSCVDNETEVLVRAVKNLDRGSNSTTVVVSNGGSICNVTIGIPYIVLNKTANLITANPMDEVTYTIDYNNTGNIADDVWINDTLPAGVEFLGSSVSPSSQSGLTYRWHLSNVAFGDHNITVTVRVNDSDTDGQVLLNNVTCSYSKGGTVLAEDNDSATVTVIRPVMSITKTAPANAVINDVFNYTIVIMNTGNGAAYRAVIIDNLPDGLTYVSDDHAGDHYLSNLSWLFTNIAPGTEIRINITVRVNDTVPDGTLLINSAALNYVVSNGYGWQASDSADTLISSPEIMVVKTVSARVVGHNELLNYTIYYNNTGSTSATEVWINDTFPSDVSFYGTNETGYTGTWPAYTWHFTDVAPGVHWFWVSVQVMPSATDGEHLINNVSLDYEVANGYSWHNNDSADTVVSIPVVSFDKTVDRAVALQGDVLTYTLYYNNSGSDSCSVNITDILAAGVSYLDSSVTVSGTSAQSLYFNLTASANSLNHITIRVTVDDSVADGTWLNNTAFMNYTADLSGTPYAGGMASAATQVLSPVMEVQKSVDHLTTGQGQFLNYTITYYNNGSATATTVWINDTLPDYVAYVNDTSGQTPTQSGNTYQYEFGDVAPGTYSFVITVRVNEDAPDNYTLVNTVVLNYSAENGHEYPGSSDTASTLVTIPDIVVEKTVNHHYAIPGDNLVYTIYFNNTGTNTAQDVWINDTLPFGVTYVSDDNNTVNPVISGRTYSWHLIDIAPGNHSFNITVSVDLSVPDSTLLQNSVTSDAVDQWGHSYPTTSDTADTIVVRPVISIVKDVSLTDAYPGDVLTYRISYDNTGHSPADVNIVDVLPAGMTFTDSSIAPTGQSALAYFWNVTVAADSTNTLFINCTVDMSVADGTVLVNNASLTYTSTNGVVWDGGSDTASTTVHRPVISVDKTVDKSVVSPGDLLVYTITFVNTGDTAQNVVVMDTLPANVTYQSDDSGIAHGTSGNMYFWNFTGVSAGTHSFNITVQVNSGTPSGTLINNTAVLNYTAENGVQVGSDSDYAESIVSSIIVSKVVDRVYVSAGEYLNYTIYFNNTADVMANHVWINDTLPAGVSFNASYYNSTRVLPDSSIGQVYRWHFTNVSANSLNMLVVTVRVDAGVSPGQELRNVVFLNYTDDSDSLMQESYSEATSWVRAPAITVSKTVDRGSAEPGDILTYTIYYNNTGSDNSAGVWVNDTLPAGVSFINSTEEGARTGMSWHFTNVSVGGHSFQIKVQIDANVTDGTTLNNTVTCEYTSAGGVSMPSSSDYAVTTVGRPVITVQKSVSSAVAEPSDLVVYTITFDNTGSGVAADVWINDTLPAQVSYHTDNSGIVPYVSGTFYSWHFTNVAPSSHSFQIYAYVTSTADNVTVNNTVYCNYTGSSHQPLINTESSDSATFTIVRPIITVEKIVDMSTAYPGDVLTYTIYYNNTGSRAAADVWINDTLPDSTVRSWHFSDVAVGNHNITFTYTVPATASDGDVLVNDVTCDYSSYAGNPYGRTGAQVTTTIMAPVISVVKQVDLSVATVGDVLNYTIYFNNTGSGTAGTVWINDTLPAGLTVVSQNASANMVSPGHWIFNNVSPGLHSFYFTAVIGSSVADNTTLVNSVSLDYSVNSGLNGPRSADTASTLVYRPMITVEKIVDMAAASPGDYLNYTIYYNNTGHASAGDVWINDTLPAGVTFVTSSDEPHRIADYAWHILDVAPGTHSLTVTVHILEDIQSASLTNWVFLNYTTTAGVSLEESNDSANTLVNAPHIVVEKIVDRALVYPNGTLVYTVYYNNTGTGVAGDVWINDTLPAGVTYVSDTSGVAPVISGSRYSWHFTSVSSATHSFTITVTVGDLPDGTILVNDVTCEYTAENGLLMVPSSDSASSTVIRPVISVQKSVNLDTAYPGDTLVYTITFENTGSGTAADVWINDTLPAGVTYISSSQAYERHNSNLYVWHFTDVAPGSHSLSITVQVLSTTPDNVYLSNGVELNYTTQFSSYYGGNDTATTHIIRPVLSLVKTVDHAVASPGMFLNYTIYYNNTGHGVADIWINDTLPSDVIFVTSSDEANRTGEYTWHFAGVSPGTYMLQVTVQVNTSAPNGTITNYAYLDYGYGSLSDSVSTEITSVATVKTVSAAHASPGDPLTYTIWYNNTAGVNAVDVWINDTLPSGVTFGGATPSPASSSGLTYRWHFTSVAPGSHSLTVDVTINATTLPGTVLTNYVHLNYTMGGINMPGSEDTATTVVDTPVITVEKVVDTSEATLGSVLTYTVYYNNTGTARANDVWINDTLPFGVTFGTSSAEVNRTDTSWHFKNVTVGGHSFTFTVTVDNIALPDNSDIVNHVFLNYTDQQNHSLDESNASATTHFTRPDITVSKIVDRSTAAPGDTLVYTIYFNNTGHDSAGTVWINDTLPQSFVTYVSDTNATESGVWDSPGHWHFNNVAPGEHSFTITAIVNNVVNGTPIENIADLNYTTTEGFHLSPSNDSANTTVLVTTLTVDKIADRTTAYPREIITYTIFFNVTGALAQNVWINDTLPNGVAYYSGPTGIEHTSSGQFHSWHLTDVSVGVHSITVQVKVSADASNGTTLTNSVIANYTNWEDTFLSNTPPVSVDVTVVRPVITISKTGPDTAYPGDDVTYTISIVNNGGTASDVWVNDTLPFGVIYSVASIAPVGTSGNTYFWHFTSVSGTITFTVTVHVTTMTNGDVLHNSISCEYAAGGYSYADVPNATADTTVIRPIITISKSVDLSTASPGDTLTYTITYNNLGDGIADRVWINDTLPAGTEWVSDTSGVSPQYWGNIYNWTIPNVSPGPHMFTVTVMINSSVSDGDILNNTVAGAYRQANMVVYLSNGDYATTLVTRANISFNLVEMPSPMYPGDGGFYIVTFNSTASSYCDVTVTLVLPDGVTYLADNSGRHPLRDGNNLTWIFYDVAPGTLESFYVVFGVQAHVDDNTILTATGYLDYTGTNGYHYPQLIESASFQVIRPIIEVAIVADRSVAQPGDDIVYTVYYNNTGHGTASTVEVDLNISGPFSYVSDTSGVSYTLISGVYVYEISGVAPGIHSFTVTVHVSEAAGNGDRIKGVSALNYEISNGLAFNPSTDSAITEIVRPIMTLEKSVDVSHTSPGGIVVFTITYSNTGAANASDVWINDTLQAGMTFITSSDEANRTGMSWHFTDVAPGTYTLTITVSIDSEVANGAHLVNTATLDYVASNGLKYETLSASTTVTSERPFIQVAKIADLYNVTAGSYVNYTIYYNNTLSGTAANVWINDTLSENVTYITDTSGVTPLVSGRNYSWHFTNVTFGPHMFIMMVQVNDGLNNGTPLINNVTCGYTAESGLLIGNSSASVTINVFVPPAPVPSVDNGPVIHHTPIERQRALVDMNITAVVTDDFGVSHVYLFYATVGNSTFSRIDMTLVSGDVLNGTYNATIPGQVWKGVVSYYIWANDTAGNVTIHGVHDIEIYLPSYTVWGHVYQASGDPIEQGYVLVTNNATGDSLVYVVDPTGYYSVDLAEMSEGYVNGDSLSVYGTDGNYYNTVYGTVDVMAGNSLNLDLYLIYIPEFSSMLVLLGVFLIVVLVRRRRR